MECVICLNLLSEEGEVNTPNSDGSKAVKRTKQDAKNSVHLNITSCGHIFHRICVLSWLERGNNTCPNCRKPLTKRQLKAVYLPESTTAETETTVKDLENSDKSSDNNESTSSDDQCPNCQQLQKKVKKLECEKMQALRNYRESEKEKEDLKRKLNEMMPREEKDKRKSNTKDDAERPEDCVIV